MINSRNVFASFEMDANTKQERRNGRYRHAHKWWSSDFGIVYLLINKCAMCSDQVKLWSDCKRAIIVLHVIHLFVPYIHRVKSDQLNNWSDYAIYSDVNHSLNIVWLHFCVRNQTRAAYDCYYTWVQLDNSKCLLFLWILIGHTSCIESFKSNHRIVASTLLMLCMYCSAVLWFINFNQRTTHFATRFSIDHCQNCQT